MILAIINGSAGFVCAMGVMVFGAVACAKAVGETIAMSYGVIVCLAIFCGVLRGILRYFEQYSNHFIAFKLLAVLRDKIFFALRTLCPAKLENKQKGSIIAMITSDIETLEVFYAHTISPICIAVLVSVAVVIFVSIVSNVFLALTALIGYLTIGIIIPIISSSKLKISGVKYRSEFAKFNAYFLDSIKGIKEIVINNAGENRKQEVNHRSDLLLKETKNMKHKISLSNAVTEMAVSLFIVLALITGIILVNFEMLTIGKMIIGLVTIFSSFGPVIALSALTGNLTQTLASGDRLLNLLNEEPVVKQITNGSDIKYESLKVENLSFSYDGQAEILKNINIAITNGKIVGIIGKSGCGKSTFLKLLLRFWQKDNGKIAYNNIDIDKINTFNLHENVTMVSQNTYLFDESIEDNLRLAKPLATKEEIEEACRMASVHDFIKTLPNGYKTQVGSLGNNLSAGEKQRIGLARAFLRGSKLILLDEPTSNVDSINEGIILKALIEQKSKKSIILVSHRESTMAIADYVYIMEDGKLREGNV